MLIALPTADRSRSFAFYTAGLGFTAFGPIADDGVPEPLQFDVDGTHLMFVPTGGFGWITGGRPTASGDVTECLLSLSKDTDDEVDQVLDAAKAAGGVVVMPAERKPWGYVGAFADPDGHLWQVINS